MVKRSILWTAIAATFSVLAQNALANDVIELTEKDFKDKVYGEDLMLVEFFAPWCGHCKALAPEYELAATELKPKGIKLAKVDCTENQDLCTNDYDVRGYPTLKVFRKNNKHTEYKGPRKADGIVKYMIKQASPAITTLTSENFESFKSSDRAVIVGYTSASDESSKSVFQSIAEKLRDDYLFGLVTDDILVEQHNVPKLPTVVVYKQFDEGRNDREGEFEEAEIEEFIKTNSIPLLDEVDTSNFQSYLESGLPLAYIFADSKEMLQPLAEAITPVAKQFKGKVNFVHIDASKFGAHAENLGLKDQWPGFAIQRLDSGAKYPFNQASEISTKNIEAFVEGVLDGKIKATLKSEKAPEDNDGPVKVVVADEFDDIVFDKTKDVFLEVYAPWCGHCKRLAPIWTQLGEIVKSQDATGKLVIAKLDGTENDIPEQAGFQVTGFPTLKFIKANTNEVIDYEGDRSREDLVRFINEQSSVKISTDDAEELPTEEDIAHDEL